MVAAVCPLDWWMEAAGCCPLPLAAVEARRCHHLHQVEAANWLC